tara:strand:- start:1526 stop:2113 length:588 start_codon:yes stop_codon:yes gene_type:complete
MNQLLNLFSTPVYLELIDKNEFLNSKQDILQFITDNPYKFINKWNCNTKSNIGSNFLQDSKSEKLKKIIISTSKKYLNKLEIKCKNIRFDDLWINIAPLGAHQEPHSHLHYNVNNVFSGTLYININEHTGRLRFQHPNTLISNLLPPLKHYPDHFDIDPQEGLLVYFPSSLTHEVTPNNSNMDRISVSWNIQLEY